MNHPQGRRSEVMHHYWVKEAGDAEAVGEYFPTGDERYGVPVYRNQSECPDTMQLDDLNEQRAVPGGSSQIAMSTFR